MLNKIHGFAAAMGLCFTAMFCSVFADESRPQVSNPDLEKAVGEYVTAWQKQDFEKMHTFENWQGGNKLPMGIKYLQNFDAGFQIRTWQITRVWEEKKDEYLVLVLISHTPTEKVRVYLPPGMTTVNSTLRQYWKKQGDQYTHLFHVEKQKLLGGPPPPQRPIKPPYAVRPPERLPESKPADAGNGEEDKEKK
ncbi:MAG: hypothetical protein GY862_06875 [Gammaproteobacteria bacterium]|nr:hypothetical protein [Gammaproteobacteria bacterium]